MDNLDNLDKLLKSLKRPTSDQDSKEKSLKMKHVVEKRLAKHSTSLERLERNSKDTFIFGEYKAIGNCLGIFKLQDDWFIYSEDERENNWFSGPFSYNGAIFAFVLKAGIAEWFSDYKFNAKEEDIFINNGFNSLHTLMNNLSNNNKITLINNIIDLLNKKIDKTTDNDNLKFIKSRYETALSDLYNNQPISVDLRQMSRLYLESYSDYMNPVLSKMYELDDLIYSDKKVVG